MINTSTFVYNSSKKFFEPIPQCSIWELQNSSGKFEYIDGYISVQYFDYELMGNNIMMTLFFYGIDNNWVTNIF